MRTSHEVLDDARRGQWMLTARAEISQRRERGPLHRAVVGTRQRHGPRQIGLEQQSLDQFAQQRGRAARPSAVAGGCRADNSARRNSDSGVARSINASNAALPRLRT